MAREIARQTARADASRVQRERQQGLGKPIISTVFQGTRLVAVKNRLLHSKGWKTFHDFLGDYIKNAIGSVWGNAEIAKPPEQRHPIISWYQALCRHQRLFVEQTGSLHGMPQTGAAAAYLHLAYDLYALDHNAELQETLLGRLRNHERFTGARYEIQVAAAFIRAGFDIAFEDETDGSTTHCEFTATYRRTGRQFSVEAKRREGYRPRIGRLFNDALSKRANHPRIVFIDLNMRDDGPRTEQAPPAFFQSALRRLRSFEHQPLNGEPRPSAYVFLTNTPWPLYLDDPAPRSGFLAEGFQTPDFKEGVWFPSLRQIINAREAHIEMHNLMESIRDHSEIPSTFDGEIPEFAFDQNSSARLLIGSRYLVKDADGVERPAELTTATVAEDERQAYCGMSFDNGKSGIWTVPLSDAEMAAWKRYPDTFFGELGLRTTRAETPLELYDFFHQSFKRCSKEQLLKAMADAADIDTLARLEQEELASIHAERLTYGALAMKDK